MTSPFRHDVPGTPAEAWWRHPGRGAVADLALTDRAGRPATRVVVVAAHPDDETLGAGGLLAVATTTPHVEEVHVVVLTDGEGSHPDSPTTSPAELGAARRRECREALDRLGPGIALTHLGLPDGGLAGRETDAAATLTTLLGDGAGTVLLAPYRRDGHPDHEAAGRASAAAAQRTGSRLLEYPVWFWHWAAPDDAPWARMRRLTLAPDQVTAKQRALDAHRSQLAGLSDRPGDGPLLGEDVLAHFLGAQELLVEEPAADPTLDRLHEEVAEPWGADTRWYEERKRALLLAVLPARTFRRGLDVGCSTGATTAALAGRCERLVAVDESAAAVAAARTRLAGEDHVAVVRGRVPDELPEGPFDLVVVSEVGYFLSPADLDALAAGVAARLDADGVVVLCHWRHPVEGWLLDAAAVHHAAESGLGLERLAAYSDRDVEILLFGPADRLPDPSR